ncbi:MAG: hypothetical protein KKA42_06105 [candidate division Zixibacteria bacterium]|nr:hypothetical protein [candidate division Zixibacteria bacterium]
MKKVLLLGLCLALGLTFLVGCGEQEAEQEPAAGGHVEEMADSTRMDSALVDSAAAVMEEGTEAAEEAVEGGH